MLLSELLIRMTRPFNLWYFELTEASTQYLPTCGSNHQSYDTPQSLPFSCTFAEDNYLKEQEKFNCSCRNNKRAGIIRTLTKQ
jgi:hypothetical protein